MLIEIAMIAALAAGGPIEDNEPLQFLSPVISITEEMEKRAQVQEHTEAREERELVAREAQRNGARIRDFQFAEAVRVEAERLEAERQATAAEAARVEEAQKAAAGYSVPVAEYRITATFGESGPHWSSTHTGLDFAAPSRSTVMAVHGGRITFAGWDGAYGNKIVITHDDGSQAWYGHLSSIDGSGRVGAGDKIGEVGATGNVTGPHLHLEIRVGGSLVDPGSWLALHGVGVY